MDDDDMSYNSTPQCSHGSKSVNPTSYQNGPINTQRSIKVAKLMENTADLQT